MRAICANPASPLGENDFFRNQTGKLGEEFKNVDLHTDKRYRRLYFEIFSRGGKESSEPRSVKYKHGVLISPKA